MMNVLGGDRKGTVNCVKVLDREIGQRHPGVYGSVIRRFMCSTGAMKSTGETPPMPARPDDGKDVRSELKRSVSPQSRSRSTGGPGAMLAPDTTLVEAGGGARRSVSGASNCSGAEGRASTTRALAGGTPGSG